MMRKILARTLALCLTGCVAFSVACGGVNNDTSVNSDSSVSESVGDSVSESEAPIVSEDPLPVFEKGEIWTASGTEKILQTQDYSSRYKNKTLKIGAFRNEHESGQIVITPSENIQSYTIRTADLTDGKGNVLEKENFEIFYQKYITVKEIKNGDWPYKAGDYPDALLPQSAAESYGENKIVSGENQGIWITVQPPKTQTAGVYKGEFEIVADGVEYSVPVEIAVYDYTLSDERHATNYFVLNWTDVAAFEGMPTASMDEAIANIPLATQQAYYDFLLEYDVNANSLPGSTMNYEFGWGPEYNANEIFEENFNVRWTFHEDRLAAVVEAVAKSTADPRCTAYSLPIQSNYVQDENGDLVSEGITCVDKLVMKRLVEDMYTYSMEHGLDLFAKAYIYPTWIDEFDQFGKEDWAKANLEWMNGYFEELSAYLATKSAEYPLGDGVTESFRAQVLQSLSEIQLVVTAMSTSMLDPEKHPMIFCPTIDEYHTEEERAEIFNWAESAGVDRWSYTCVNPHTPYPTYHIDDYLISSRLLDWMMYEYDIVGNLYWNTVLSWDANDDNYGNTLEDFYQTAARYPEANGDGFLLYPGNVYGITGPVGSVRLQSIRDGAEDYNLLYALEQYYIERASEKGEAYDGEGFHAVLRSLMDELYSGARCIYEDNYTDLFQAARERLAEMLVLAEQKGVLVENCEVSDTQTTYTVSAAQNVSLTLNGTTSQSTKSGITTYRAVLGVNEGLQVTVGETILRFEPYELPQVDYTWGEVRYEDTANGRIYPNTRYYMNSAAFSVDGGKVNSNKNGNISVVTLSAENPLGGKTEGTFYKIVPQTMFKSELSGFTLLPDHDKAFYEDNYTSSARLKFDVYYQMVDGTWLSPNRLYFTFGATKGQKNPAFTWYTIEISLDTILRCWNDLHNPTGAMGVAKVALFSVRGRWEQISNTTELYIGNFRIEK